MNTISIIDNYANVILDATNIMGSFPYMEKNNIPIPAGLPDIVLAGFEKYSTRTMLGSDFPVGFGEFNNAISDLKKLGVPGESIATLTWEVADLFYQQTSQSIKAL